MQSVPYVEQWLSVWTTVSKTELSPPTTASQNRKQRFVDRSRKRRDLSQAEFQGHCDCPAVKNDPPRFDAVEECADL